MAGFSSSGAPLEDLKIGSSTMLGGDCFLKNPAIASTTSPEPSMPMRTAAISKSRASSCNVCSTSLAATGCTDRTPVVDCTVSAVMHVIA